MPQITSPAAALSAATLRAGAGPGQQLTYNTVTGLYEWKSPSLVPPNQWTYIGNVLTAGPLGQSGIAFQNSWTNFGGGYGPARFTIDGRGKVRLTGLISGGGYGSPAIPFFTLPVGYRPDYPLLFNCQSNVNGGEAEVIVKTNGEVSLNNANYGSGSGYVSLNSISFFPAGFTGWSTLAYANSWTTSSGAAPARYYIDPDGICHWSGLIASGTVNLNFFSTWPTAVQRPATLFGVGFEAGFMQPAFGGAVRVDVSTSPTTGMNVSAYQSGGTNGYVSLDGIEYRTPSCTLWVHQDQMFEANSYYVNSWVSYSLSVFPPLSLYKDSYGWCHMEGLVKSGTTGLPLTTMVLPGYRMPNNHLFAVCANNVQSRIDLGNNSSSLQISGYGTGGSNAFVFLDGLNWPAEC